MRISFPLICIGSLIGWPLGVAADNAEKTKQWEAAFEKDIQPIVRDFCNECHQGTDADGGLDLAQFTTGDLVTKKMDVWNEIGKRLRLKEMPPEGSPQLNDEQKGKILAWLDGQPNRDLCSQLANEETQAWYRGFVMSRRLTRTEYLNAIRDLVGLEVPSSIEIPSDGSGGEGFDTNGDSLFTSPIHIEQYLQAASTVMDAALPNELPPTNNGESSAKLLAARERILIAVPTATVADRDAAKIVLKSFARRAWRRPVADHEVDRMLTLFDAAKQRGAGFVEAIRDPLKAILVSPHFLFVVETESAQGGVQRLTQHELATRMALFIWSSIPDDELLRHADEGLLDAPDQILAQTRRLLADDRAIALGANFGMQWLGLKNFLSSVKPDREIYPEFSDQLSQDLHQEAIRFIASVFREDRSLLDLLDSKYVVVNGNLAQHYGLELPSDAPWQRLETADRRRGGVMTMGATLMAASYPRRTSPVLRGRWILEELLGSQVPPPPPNVPALQEAEAQKATTLRERLELHRKNPDCASCHNRMDPIGFGLENFDALGRWRETDQGLAIDSSGQLPSGEKFQGPEELKKIILNRSGEFEAHVVKKLLGFALGRELNEFDHCVIKQSIERLAAENHRSSSVIETIVLSYPFQHRFFKAATKVETNVQ
jgi:mono/diheme cytochrome c family protein